MRRPPLTVVLVNNGGGGIFSFLPIEEALPRDVFVPLWATPQNVDLGGLCRCGWLVSRSPIAMQLALPPTTCLSVQFWCNNNNSLLSCCSSRKRHVCAFMGHAAEHALGRAVEMCA